MKIVTVEEMRGIEQAAVVHGVTLDLLQRNAAAAIAREVAPLAGDTDRAVLFLAGPGNNGRDALIAAAILSEGGRRVRCYLAPRVSSEDVLALLATAGAEILRDEDPDGREILRGWIKDAAAVVDGLLGIGISGPVREPMAQIISTVDDEARSSRVPVIAVDLPSGIDADTGAVDGPAIHATWTLSLGCVKTGLLRFPAAQHVGRLLPLEIGLPPGIDAHIRLQLITPSDVASLLPPRPLDAHKGSFGRVLALTGSRNFVGASYLVGGAAARSGCGIITLAVPEWQRVALAPLLPEATYLPLLDTVDSDSARRNARAVAETLPDCNVLAIGPGLGQGQPQTELVMGVLATARHLEGLQAVVDADALNALVAVERWWERIGPGYVLTPHPGEMSRLVGLGAGEVNARRWEVAREAAARWGQIVMLKGAFTVVAAPDGSAWVSDAALPALATGGTGDVLAGIIAGLMAQGLAGIDAARAGIFLHAAAARFVLASTGADRLLASELLPAIPSAIAEAQRVG